jgi:purine-nucleoside phosphorylase
MDEVTFPMRVLAGLGIQSVLLTNAAGGINRRFRAGDFMALTEKILIESGEAKK